MGTRLIVNDVAIKYWDHPHAYGDKTLGRASDNYQKGSSPRVWGQVEKASRRQTAGRIIPTRMGTSHTLSAAFFQAKDHPHAYGDKCPKSATQILQLGSSPRVWGQVFWCFVPKSSPRIIPTRMGTSHRWIK